jgi:hypothetical protein
MLGFANVWCASPISRPGKTIDVGIAAVHTDILPSRASCRHGGGRLTSADRPYVLKGLSGVNEPPDHHPHDDFAAPSAARSVPCLGRPSCKRRLCALM